MIPIKESNMNFGPFDESDVFYIEESQLYKKIGKKVQIAEFILKKGMNLIFIEAKSSSPKQLKIPVEIEKYNPYKKEMEKVKIDYPSPYIIEICNKLMNALDLFISANLKIIDDKAKESKALMDFNTISDYTIKFMLVINTQKYDKISAEDKKQWMSNIQDALQKELLAKSKIWKIEVKVMNDETAREYKLIS